MSDPTLADMLLAQPYFDGLVADGQRLVETEIDRKGMTVRTAVRMVKKIKPEIVQRTVRELMPQFLAELEPCHAEFKATDGSDFGAYLAARDERVAEAVLQVADRRAERIGSRPIRSAYARMRARAITEVRSAVPALARIIEKHRREALAD